MSRPSTRFHWYSFSCKFATLLAFSAPLFLVSFPVFPTAEGFVVPQQRRLQSSPISNVASSNHESRLRLYLEPSLIESLTQGYVYCNEYYYIPTQSATGAICAALGDVIAQKTESNDSDSQGDSRMSSGYDAVRTFHYFLKGIGGGIAWAYWFEFAEPLSNALTLSVVGEDAPSIAEQATKTVVSILLEQFLMSPFIFIFWDIPLPALLRGSPLRQIPSQVESKLFPLLIANSKVWTFANLITYNIPMDYRVLFSSLTDILWQSINASITSQEVPSATLPSPVEIVEEGAPAPSRLARRQTTARSNSAVAALGASSSPK